MFQPPIELRPSDSLVNHYSMDISGRETDIALYLEKIYLEDSINHLAPVVQKLDSAIHCLDKLESLSSG